MRFRNSMRDAHTHTIAGLLAAAAPTCRLRGVGGRRTSRPSRPRSRAISRT